MKAALFLSLILCASVFAAPSQKAVRERVGGELPSLLKLYQHLHANPEISFQEKETAKTLAAELEKIGFEVSTGIGGHGVVGVLKNGAGSTISSNISVKNREKEIDNWHAQKKES